MQNDPFEKAKEIIDIFLTDPPRLGNDPVSVNLSYNALVNLVHSAYVVGNEDQRRRRELVNPFVKEADPSSRFTNIEF